LAGQAQLRIDDDPERVRIHAGGSRIRTLGPPCRGRYFETDSERGRSGEKHSDTFEHISDKTVETAGTNCPVPRTMRSKPNCKLNRREYERELVRLHVTVASHAFLEARNSSGGRHGCRLSLSVVCPGRSQNWRTGIVWELLADTANAASLRAPRSNQGQARGALC
jgi:hypothetical protein